MVSIRAVRRKESAAAQANSYEEIRRQRVEQNLKHLEGLGISEISKNLLAIRNKEPKMKVAHTSSKVRKSTEPLEIRRSSRTHNRIVSYYEEVNNDIISHRRTYSSKIPHHRRSIDNGRREYTGRVASFEQKANAMRKAEAFQCDLDSCKPSFVKCMVRSHVSSCFWLGLPRKFCMENLPPNELRMVLEDEEHVEYDAIYIGARTGLSGGWRGFAMDHKLEDGDVLVFELFKPARFKVYIFKACGPLSQDGEA